MSSEEKVRRLNGMLRLLESEARILKKKMPDSKDNYDEVRSEITKIRDEITQLKSLIIIRVSDHAIIRYFERYMYVNFNTIKDKILSEELIKKIHNKKGYGTFILKDNFKVVVKDYVVVTILKTKKSESWKHKQKLQWSYLFL